MSGLDDVVAISAGRDHQMALKAGGTAWAWGSDADGQLGTTSGFGDNNLRPRRVIMDFVNDETPLLGVVDVEAGGNTSFALVAYCGDDTATRIGTNGADTINGTGQAEVIVTGAGNDDVDGGGGSDVICTGSGNDSAAGGAGNDLIDGGPGADTVDGGENVDTATFPGAAARVINLQNGTVSGEAAAALAGVENIKGSGGADNITGDAAANKIEGLNGGDTLRGGGGDDNVLGGSGADALAGQGGADDVCHGGPGVDSFLGGGPVAAGCETDVSIP